MKTVGLIGFDGMAGLDLVGPMDAFGSAGMPEVRKSASVPYRCIVLGLSTATFVSESGIVFKPHMSLDQAPPLDTIIIPGGEGWRTTDAARTVAPWLSERADSTRRIASICTGIYALAPTGLLDGRSVTTHWKHVRDVARRFPTLKIDANAIYIKDGKFYTSAGVTSGIDLSLALIEEDLGAEVACGVARELVVYMRRSGGQAQYSEPLKLQEESGERFSSLIQWIMVNLKQDLSVDVLARHQGLSTRHFGRLFSAAFGVTPAELVESVRLDQARSLLTSGRTSVEGIAATVGFHSSDAFRRAFARRFGVSPSEYRAQFSGV